MKKTYQKIKLGDVCELINGGAWKQTEYMDEGIPVVQVSNMKNGTIDVSDLKFLPPASYDRYKKHTLMESDLVIATVGSHATQASAAGRATIVKEFADGMLLNQNAVAIRSKSESINQKYLGLIGYSNKFQLYLGTVAQGAANQVRIALSAIKEYKCDLPPIGVQQRIVDVLSTYDDLIENNRRRIQLLEEAARLLFREWFVYFRFPGHEKVKIVDGVPKGWERKPISVLTSFLNRGIAPHYDEDADGLVINQKCIRGGRLDVSLARRQSREFKPDRQLQTGDILINSTGEGTLGRVAQVLAPIANCTVDTHVTIARPIPEIGVHYFGQSLMAWEPHLSTMGRGATNQTELSRGQIGEIDILVPLHSLVQQFEEYSEPIFLQVSTLLEQNQKLKAARDLLLPRLMSGAIEV